MFTPGNKKLGGRLIWGFGLPSGRPELCVGLTDACYTACYARRMEGLRPDVLTRYERNLWLSKRPDFDQLARAFIIAHEIAVVRLHTGGDFYSPGYARKWLRVMRGLPPAQFFFYTRSWRHPGIRAVLERMARRPNCRAWYSCDRGTGIPEHVPRRVRLAWLMTTPEDEPPAGMHLTFRVQRLRGRPQTRVNRVRVCPEEDGVARRRPVTCDRCGICWQPLPGDQSRRIPLAVLPG